MTLTPASLGTPARPRTAAAVRRLTPAAGYAAAVATVLVATALRWALTPLIGPVTLPYLTYFPAVFLAALLLGLRPTIVVVVLSALVADVLFFPSAGAIRYLNPVAMIGLVLFVGVGIGVALLGEHVHRTRLQAESQATENDQLRLLAEEAASQAEEEAARAEEEAARAEENATQATGLAAERADLAAAVERERAHLSAVVAQLPIGLVIRAADSGRLLMANREVERLLGRPPAPDLSSEAQAPFGFRRLDGMAIPADDHPMARVFRTGHAATDDVQTTRADGRQAVLHFEAGPVTDGDGRVTAGVLTMVDITHRRQAEEAFRFLSESSAALAASLDYEATLKTVAKLAVPGLADWCAIDLADADGVLRRIAISHADPDREAWAWEVERRYPVGAETDGGAYDVLRSGQASMVEVITPAMIGASGRDPEHVRLIHEVGLTSYIGVPLAAHGEVFGVLSLLMANSGRHFTEAELRLAEALGQRAGVAVDNARRHHVTVESANMLDAVLDASPVGQAFVDRDLCYVRVNKALARLHGVPVEAHLHRGIREVLPAWAEVLEPMHRRVFESGSPVLDRHITVPAPGGGNYDLLVNCFPVRDAAGGVRWVGVTKANVTEQRKADQAIQASEARLRRVIESPLIGIGFYERGGVVTGANRALANLLGYTPEEIASGALRWDTNLTAPEFRHLDAKAGREVAATGVSLPYEKDLLRKDGSRVPVVAGGARLDDDGRTGVFYVLDLTERRRVEEQAQAAQRLEAVGRLAGGVAHEINNALQGVLGFNAFVVRRLGPEHAAHGDAMRVQQSAERAARIAQQLLAYSRRQVLQQIDLDLTHVVLEFAPVLRQALGAECALRIGSLESSAMVHADRAQLEQVLLNITLNARDAMPLGGTLTIGVETLAARGVRTLGDGAGLHPGDYIQLTASDTGTGMDQETRARVFEPFFTTKPVGQGTGLGLSVVHGIVQQSGGYVWVDSEPGRGTTVRIVLPRVEAPATEAPVSAPAAPDQAIGGGPRGHETVLVVDDEPVVLAFIASLLRDAGYQVIEASNGPDALERFEAALRTEAAVDLVLTDLIMPGVGGRELGERLAERAPELPVLYTSGYTGDEVARRGLIGEGAAFLAKPFAPDELLQRIRGLLDRRVHRS